MKIELLNWYEMIVEVDGGKSVENYRTKKTLEQLKESRAFEGFEGIQNRAQWNFKGSGLFIEARVQATSFGDAGIAQEFNSNKKVGTKGYYTIDELEGFDLVEVLGYGFIYDFEDFKKAYEETATKK